MKKNRASLRAMLPYGTWRASLLASQMRSNLIFPILLLFTAYCLLSTISLSSSLGIISTIDVRILEIFHPHKLQIISASDTFTIYLKDNHLFINGMQETMFFSKDECTIKIKEKIKRSYRGTLKIHPLMEEIVIINRVVIDDYLASVVGAEMGEAPFEAQKAQAIVSKTYLFKNLKRHKSYDYCDLTHCQVYKGKESETESSRRAVRETAGLLLWDGDKIADVYYHSTCGGKTANFASIFEGRNESLVSVSDSNYCSDSPHYRWEWELPLEDVPFKELRVIKMAPDGRVTEMGVDSEKERGWEFRMRIARQFGWNKLRSSSFTIEKKEDFFHFTGKGLGHGLGMCQWGAKGMAEQGKKAEEILKHYFPLLEVR